MRFKEYTHHDQEGVGERSVSTRARRVEGKREKILVFILYCCFVSSKPDSNMKKRREFRALTMKILTG